MLPTTQMMMHSSSSKPPKHDESALQQKGKTNHKLEAAGREMSRAVVAAAAVDVCLAAACLAGTALLTWWALVFHPSYGQLWMVPVGLVLACTPVVVCVALHFSPAADDTRVLPPGKGGAAGVPPPLSLSSVVVVHN